MGEIYGHISVINSFGVRKSTLNGIVLSSVVMLRTVFAEQFNFEGITLQVSYNVATKQWDVTEKYTGLSACQHRGGETGKTRELAVERALSNLNKYKADGSLQTRLKKSYEAWLHTKTSLNSLTAIKLKTLKKL